MSCDRRPVGPLGTQWPRWKQEHMLPGLRDPPSTHLALACPVSFLVSMKSCTGNHWLLTPGSIKGRHSRNSGKVLGWGVGQEAAATSTSLTPASNSCLPHLGWTPTVLSLINVASSLMLLDLFLLLPDTRDQIVALHPAGWTKGKAAAHF